MAGRITFGIIIDASFCFLGTTTMSVPRRISTESCGETIRLYHGWEHYIHSANYPSNYPPNQHCVWYISAPSGYRAKIHFTAFATEDCCDYVTVYAGHNVVSHYQVADFRGNSSSLPYDIISGSEHMRVFFSSDYRISNQGFAATFSVSTASQTGVHKLNQDRGYIMSPNFPRPYGNNENVVWYITVSPGNAVELTISSMITEFGDDIIYFYEGYGTHSSALIRRCLWSGNRLVGTFKAANRDGSCSDNKSNYDGDYDDHEYDGLWAVVGIAIGSTVVFVLTVVIMGLRKRHRQNRHTQRTVQGFQSGTRAAAYYNAAYAPSEGNLAGQANHIGFPENYEPEMPLPSYAQALQMPIYIPGSLSR